MLCQEHLNVKTCLERGWREERVFPAGGRKPETDREVLKAVWGCGGEGGGRSNKIARSRQGHVLGRGSVSSVGGAKNVVGGLGGGEGPERQGRNRGERRRNNKERASKERKTRRRWQKEGLKQPHAGGFSALLGVTGGEVHGENAVPSRGGHACNRFNGFEREARPQFPSAARPAQAGRQAKAMRGASLAEFLLGGSDDLGPVAVGLLEDLLDRLVA